MIPTTALTLAWATGGPARNGLWGELARVPVELGSAQFVKRLSPNVLSSIGVGPVGGAVLAASCVAGAFVVASRAMPWAKIRAKRRDAADRRRPSQRAFLAAGVCACLVFAADVFALTDYPYGADPQNSHQFPQKLVVLHTEIAASSTESSPGGQVDFEISVTNSGIVGAADLLLTIELPPGMRLAGPPAATLGPGCRGSVTVVCDLVSIRPKSGNTAIVRLGVQITSPNDQTLTAWASAVGDPESNRASFTVSVVG